MEPCERLGPTTVCRINCRPHCSKTARAGSGSELRALSASGRLATTQYAQRNPLLTSCQSPKPATGNWSWRAATKTRDFAFPTEKSRPSGRTCRTQRSCSGQWSATGTGTSGSERRGRDCFASGRTRWSGSRVARVFRAIPSAASWKITRAISGLQPRGASTESGIPRSSSSQRSTAYPAI